MLHIIPVLSTRPKTGYSRITHDLILLKDSICNMPQKRYDDPVIQELTELFMVGPCRSDDYLSWHNDDSSRNGDDLSRGDDGPCRSNDNLSCRNNDSSHSGDDHPPYGAVVLWDMLEATKVYHRRVWTARWLGERDFIYKSIEDMELSLAKYLMRFSRSMANESCPGFHWLQHRDDAGQRASNPDPKILSSMNETLDQWYMQTASRKCHASDKLQETLKSHFGHKLDSSLNLTLNTLSKRQFTALALHHNLQTLIIIMRSLGCQWGIDWGKTVLEYAGGRIVATVAGSTVV
ncbi:hypothetical protein EDB80DRAFT_823263 [Ilyonectria destructans]|nr:hypothetical protein EDB80DRAFT_823263 [Ilyonectria destructans]